MPFIFCWMCQDYHCFFQVVQNFKLGDYGKEESVHPTSSQLLDIEAAIAERCAIVEKTAVKSYDTEE